VDLRVWCPACGDDLEFAVGAVQPTFSEGYVVCPRCGGEKALAWDEDVVRDQDAEAARVPWTEADWDRYDADYLKECEL